MPAASKKRRTAAQEENSSSDEEVTQNTQRRKRRTEASSDEDGDTTMDVEVAEDDQNQVVKKLVRYAMACDYSRTVIRRDDIRTKVLGKQKMTFRKVFEAAQDELRRVFGMEMVELPLREKTTLKDRLASGKTAVNQASSNAYILATVLPAKYRSETIIPPSSVPTTSTEASYTGLYTMIISLITLSGGKLASAKLDRYLQRMNADVNMPMDKTEAVLAKMIRQGYLVKVRDNLGGEEIVEWTVGPRGRLEVGRTGVGGLVLEAYGEAAPDDLSDRVNHSLTVQGSQREVQKPAGTQHHGNGEGSRRGRGRPRRAPEDD